MSSFTHKVVLLIKSAELDKLGHLQGFVTYFQMNPLV